MSQSMSFRSRIGNAMPKWLKRSLIWLYNRPARINYHLFMAAMNGTLPCPDEFFLKWMFRNLSHAKLNLKNPVTYQDKINWMKLHYRNPLFTKLVDKYQVRDWVADKIGKDYLVPFYGIFDKFDDIDFNALPDKFVLKCTHDSGSIVICKDKSKLDIEDARLKLNACLRKNPFLLAREWPYKNVVPRIICEGLLEDSRQDDLADYKFHCFGGKVKLIGVYKERRKKGGPKCNLYDIDWNKTNIMDYPFPNRPEFDECPGKFHEMVRLAETLSSGIPYVRVDFYYVNDRIYFGEMTFFHHGGRKMFKPYEVNLKMGEWITLPEKIS